MVTTTGRAPRPPIVRTALYFLSRRANFVTGRSGTAPENYLMRRTAHYLSHSLVVRAAVSLILMGEDDGGGAVQ